MKSKLILPIIGLFGLCMVVPSFAAEHESGQMDEESTAGMTQGDEYSQNLHSFSKLKGSKIFDANGENVGQIGDIIVDSESGRVSYVLLQSGGIFGVGDSNYPIPWQALQTREDQKSFQLQLTSQEMENAPTGAQIASKDQAKKIHEFYGVSPYWEEEPRQEFQRDMEPESEEMAPEPGTMEESGEM